MCDGGHNAAPTASVVDDCDKRGVVPPLAVARGEAPPAVAGNSEHTACLVPYP
jgi:hypothetical protein